MKRKTYSYLRGRTQRIGAKFEARPTEYKKPAPAPAPEVPLIEEPVTPPVDPRGQEHPVSNEDDTDSE